MKKVSLAAVLGLPGSLFLLPAAGSVAGAAAKYEFGQLPRHRWFGFCRLPGAISRSLVHRLAGHSIAWQGAGGWLD